MSGFANFLAGLIPIGIKAFTQSRDQEMQDAGKTTQKAKQDADSLKNAVSARSSDDVVERMPDADVRASKLGSFRD